MNSEKIEVFLGQEINIVTRNTRFKQFKRQNTIRDYHFVTSESKTKFLSYKKLGGTFCITGPRFKSRITERITDYMGRWVGCIIRTKGLLIAALSIYQTVDNTHHGPTSIFSQQAAILLKEGRKIPPRNAFFQDLITVVKILQARQIEVILAGGQKVFYNH